MADATPVTTGYPPTLTEVERVEIAHALSFHFESICRNTAPECRADFALQYEVICTIVQRILNRRAGVI